ncbi:FAD/NAD(P)-binding domain-containing protein [Dothidotthia symphoricarpi CBS 119687]|uniref:FAD/NAD(P)-binding domain-containing protein n=1 Tax=Dothidotthia symphoricarpi CBS 119687 TaxID=1392245 RepID=A0A6A6A8U7_9PLEO|nr:FAD/NAD(P)-binding domain-containing protein [Dothidotthia symphoricarpi CBS 119687]KAF2128279.1 FAD/NAD(P)-binding domain-containing protein [Dothidotthia symphoricarpi CBS 119687]
MTSRQKQRLRIAICGGGIAGLTVAAFLAKCPDIDLHVFEGKSNIRAIGAGIAVWKRYWEILEEISDFSSECTSRGLQIRPWSDVTGPVVRRSDNPSRGIDFVKIPHGPRHLPRDDLVDILHGHVNDGRCHINTNKKLTAWAQQDLGKIVVNFEDSTSIIVDLLIGADGVHSCVRQGIFKGTQNLCEPEFSGQFAYRLSCSRAELEKQNPDNEALRGFKIWCGKGRHVTSNTVRDEIQITAYDNVFDANGSPAPFSGPWVSEVPAAWIAERYNGWEPDLVSLLQLPKTASRWAIHVVHPLPSFVADRVCLIGDAAHAMTPHRGLGGGQGIEDAYILARLIADSRTTAANLPNVLKIYDSIQRPSSQEAARQSFVNGLLYGFLDPRVANSSLGEVAELLIDSCSWMLEKDAARKGWAKAESALATLV